MEEEVFADELAQIVVGTEILEPLAALAQQGDLGLGHPSAGAAGGVTFEQRPQRVEVFEVVGRVHPDRGTPVRRRNDETLDLEHQ